MSNAVEPFTCAIPLGTRCVGTRNFSLLSGWRHEVVPHTEGRGRTVLNEDVEQEENRVPNTELALQLQGPSVYMPLQQNFEKKDCVGSCEHCLGISTPEGVGDTDEGLRKRLLTDVIKEAHVIVEHN